MDSLILFLALQCDVFWNHNPPVNASYFFEKEPKLKRSEKKSQLGSLQAYGSQIMIIRGTIILSYELHWVGKGTDWALFKPNVTLYLTYYDAHGHVVGRGKRMIIIDSDFRSRKKTAFRRLITLEPPSSARFVTIDFDQSGLITKRISISHVEK